MKKETITKLKELQKDETVLWAEVQKLGRKNVDGKPADVMTVMLPAVGQTEPVKVTIEGLEADENPNHGSLVRLIGRSIPFVVFKVEDDKVLGSRKIAQQKLKAEMLQDLVNGTAFVGQITGLTPKGAFVEVNGVPGLLRNKDCTTDHSEVSEHFKVGDTITVKCRDVASDGRINWECPSKLARKEPIELDFAVDMIIPGVVANITSFGNTGVGVFVRVGQGVDALCFMPADIEIFPHQKVAVKVTRIDPDPKNPNATPKVRGKIVRVL